mmetsp:Transcript_49529/g.105945  ORF Transcript_49529/g.105945 Transcript_49529/m.105945 type:complete len:631 (-) Transcript_49529:29-1921(-)
MLSNPQEAAPIVGEPVGIREGTHGVEEVVQPGTAGQFYTCHLCALVPWWIFIFLQWPISTLFFLVIYAGQFLTGCFYPCCGVACCYEPWQLSYIHSLYVIWHTVKQTCCGLLCCCGWCVQVQPGVLVVTNFLATPPKFIFDEDKDIAFLMTFSDYVERKKATFPTFSGKYRAIDGGGNQQRYTFMGQGGRGYAMNEPFQIISESTLPDPDAMCKALEMRRTFKEAPFGQAALSTWFANVAIHDFFRSATGSSNKYTGGIDKPWVNLHSSYLDLQPLYGFNESIARSGRSFENGYLNKVAETRFDGSRIPESKVIIELLRREHNYVCDQLKQRYGSEFDSDEKLYQQARLIMGAVYINIILRQYGDQMFGENAPEGRIFAELRQKYGCWPSFGHSQTCGNHVTFNFNLIYRWHTGIPAEWSAAKVAPSTTDADMRAIIEQSVTWKAGGFGPNNSPQDLFQGPISVSAAAVKQGRVVGAPRLNDFRRRFGAPYRDFLDMCGDAAVAAEVAKWYPSIEDVELAVGVQVEKCSQGGWCLSDTTGIAVVADAFNSIRQDRFYTDDFKEEVYTPWGLEHAKSTILADIINRHLGMKIDRNSMISRVPGWAPTKWSDMVGYPAAIGSFDERGFPILK